MKIEESKEILDKKELLVDDGELHQKDVCECGEEHHHHHHDDCECGEEHHHHHHEDCECGEEHHHHHHEDCECGEDHHHHHHDECDDVISIVHHDGALAASFKVNVEYEKASIDKIIKGAMVFLGGIIERECGVVGHIKAAISSKNQSVMYSLTDDEVFRVGDFSVIDKVDSISFAAIVYGIDEKILIDFMHLLKGMI